MNAFSFSACMEWLNSKALVFGIVFLSCFFLFYSLGVYPLWDDEALIGLYGQNILNVGDTSVYYGENIIAYRGGILIQKGFDRALPPLSSYLAAGSFALFGVSALTARLPFALITLCGIILSVWLVKLQSQIRQYGFFFFLSLLGCTPLFLFGRQCRYYALVMFLSLIIIYLLLARHRGTAHIFGASIACTLLFASNCMNWAVLMAVLLVDYVGFRKYQKILSLRHVAYFLIPQAILNLLLASMWNPLATPFGSYGDLNGWRDRLELFFWNLRDLDAGGFMPVFSMVLIPVMGCFMRDLWLIRGFIALLVYVFFVSLVSPQVVSLTQVADIRYLVALIPLSIGLHTRFFGKIASRWFWPAKGVLAVLILSSLPTASFLVHGIWQSYPFSFARELIYPVPDPFTPSAEWIRKHVSRNSSVWIIPDYMTYPMMFDAPHAIYAWQLDPKQKSDPQFSHLPDIHFRGVLMPDYIVAFGPMVKQVRQYISQWATQGVRYNEEARLLTFGKDLYRPELFWRTFKPIENFDPNTEAIYIFKKQP
jgi:4-amino-4-deoxy-L-arabinose transferase-like glycosyltransferase